MNAEPQPIRSLRLKNGLDLKLYDESCKVAGDRWRVRMVARIEIPVAHPFPARLDDGEGESARRQILGAHAVYRQVRERNFVDGASRHKVLQKLCRDFLNVQRDYLSHPDFGPRFILKAYRTCRERKSWYADAQ